MHVVFRTPSQKFLPTPLQLTSFVYKMPVKTEATWLTRFIQLNALTEFNRNFVVSDWFYLGLKMVFQQCYDPC